MTMSRCVAVLLVMFGLSACAWTEESVVLEYKPSQTAPLAGASDARVQVDVRDTRSGNRALVSVKKNGFGMEAAGIRSDREVGEVMRKAIESELRARGFELDRGSASVAIEITRFWNDFKPGLVSADAVADVSLNVKVTDAAGRVQFTKSVVAQGKESPIALASPENAKLALDRALQSAVGQLMSDAEFLKALLTTGRRVAGMPTS